MKRNRQFLEQDDDEDFDYGSMIARKLRRQIYMDRRRNPFVFHSRRQLFAATTLYKQAWRVLINDHSNKLLVAAVNTLPVSMRQQLLHTFSINAPNTGTIVTPEFWLAVAARNNIHTYNLNHKAMTAWNWCDLSIEQCFLFRCYNWLGAQRLDDDDNNSNNTINNYWNKFIIEMHQSYLVSVNSQEIADSRHLCVSCLRRICAKVLGERHHQHHPTHKLEISLNQQDATSVRGASSIYNTKRFFDDFLAGTTNDDDSDYWCHCCKIHPMFTMKYTA